MSESYLILHKVSGQPAFDIAHKLETTEQSGEEMWIVSTSGHRAYPMAFWELDSLRTPAGLTLKDEAMIPPGFKDWPDHYNLNKSAIEPSVNLDFGEMMKALIPQGSFPRRA